ncbi:hypothetical protein GCM10027614_71570 [Micromonospora vulcania]
MALIVTAVLLPLNPLRVLNRAAKPALALLIAQLDATSSALTAGDAGRARTARDELRQNQDEVKAFIEATQGAREASTLSPVHWHERHGPVGRYAHAAEPIERAMRNSGTLIRRAVTLIEDGEPIPAQLPRAVSALAEAVRLLKRSSPTATNRTGRGRRPCGRSARPATPTGRGWASPVPSWSPRSVPRPATCWWPPG